jgi:hypothetical protein
MNPVAADSLRTVLDRVFRDPGYRWHTPPNPLAFLQHWFDLVGRWLHRLNTAYPDAERIFVAVLVVLLVVILVHGSWIVVGTLNRASATEQSAGPVRVVERRDARWHRREAARLLRDGRYAESLMEEFWALIADLEARHLVRVHPSKTPGEYTFDPGLGAGERARLTVLVNRLYALVFSGRGCSADDVLAWRATADKEWGEAAG